MQTLRKKTSFSKTVMATADKIHFEELTGGPTKYKTKVFDYSFCVRL